MSYVPGSSGSAGSPGGGSVLQGEACIVFRPGGVAGGNVFTDGELAFAALQNIEGCPDLVFDDSLVSPIVLPAVALDNNLARWLGRPGGGGGHVEIPEGCTIANGPLHIGGTLRVDWTGNIASPIALTGGEVLTFEDDADINNTGAGAVPMYDGSGVVGAVTIRLRTSGSIGINGAEPVFGDFPTGVTIILIVENGNLQRDNLSGDAGSILLGIISDDGGEIGPQAEFLGTLIFRAASRARREVKAALTAIDTPAAPDINDFQPMDTTGGAFVQPLPLLPDPTFIANGKSIVFKHTAGGAAPSVIPQVPNLLDGGAGAVALAVGGSLTVITDGVDYFVV